MSPKESIESEVKFAVGDLLPFRQALLRQGAVSLGPRQLERNILLDDHNRSLSRNGCILRLRITDQATLTYKAKLTREQDSAAFSEHKTRLEIETALGDFDAAFALFSALGYQPVWRYEKYRETFRHLEIIVALDETPIGNYIEIEGPPEQLRNASEKIGFNWSLRIIESYWDLFLEARLPGKTDMTF